MEELINHINNSSFLDIGTQNGVDFTLALCLTILAPTFAGLVIAYGFVKNGIRNATKGLDDKAIPLTPWHEIYTLIILSALLSGYEPIFGTVGKLVYSLNNATAPSTEVTLTNDEYNQYLQRQLDGIKLNNDSENNTNNSAEAKDKTDTRDTGFDWTAFFLAPSTMVTSLLSGITTIILTILEYVIRIATILIAKCLFIIGPLAITFSFFPMFRGKVGEWFGSYINVLCIGTTMNLIEFVIKGSFSSEAMIRMATTNEVDGLTVILLNVCIIGVYCFSFWLTSKWIGISDAGGVVSNALRTGASMAVSTIPWSKGAPGGLATGAGSSAAEKITETTKKM